jgi:hypothetical protein
MTPSYVYRCSLLEGPNYRKKEEFCFSDSLIVVILFVMEKEGSSAMQRAMFRNKRRKFNICVL